VSGAPGAVILDFGGVIWDMRWDVARDLESRHGLPRASVFSTLYRSAEWDAVQRGRGDRRAWLLSAHRALETLAGRPLPAVHEHWRDAGGPIDANVALVRRLRGAYRVSVLSNADETLRARLAALGILDLFDDVVCSAEVGCAKPDPEIYAIACRRLDRPPAQCVFVDDHVANVEAAEAAGLRGVLYRVDRGDDLARLLAAAGVVPPDD
jgi:putative hydrolase of the HAD superfamily